jgi:hypothetical protein
MTRTIKKGLGSNPGLSKTRKSTSGAIFSTPLILENQNLFNNSFVSPRLVWACYSCGSTQHLTTFYAAGGRLAICASCKNGGLV